jgi:hypothetical protein
LGYATGLAEYQGNFALSRHANPHSWETLALEKIGRNKCNPSPLIVVIVVFPHREMQKRIVEPVQRQSELFQIVLARGATSHFPRLLVYWQQQANQNCNDRDNHQQLKRSGELRLRNPDLNQARSSCTSL